MLECLAKGINRGSFITGRSVHNGFNVKLVAAYVKMSNHLRLLQELVDPCYLDLNKGMNVYRQIIAFLLDVSKENYCI